MAVEITRKDMSSDDLRAASAQTKDAKAARRMLAIALVRSKTKAVGIIPLKPPCPSDCQSTFCQSTFRAPKHQAATSRSQAVALVRGHWTAPHRLRDASAAHFQIHFPWRSRSWLCSKLGNRCSTDRSPPRSYASRLRRAFMRCAAGAAANQERASCRASLTFPDCASRTSNISDAR